MQYLVIGKKPAFLLRPLRVMIKSEVSRLSLQKTKYEIERANLPDDYNCFEIGYCGHPVFPYAHIQLEQATKLILLHFQEEDHSFIHVIL